jgi:GNAT superfamily N-acetyltransferase
VSFGIVDKDDDDDDDFDGADPPSRGGRRTNDGDIGGGFSGRRRRRRRRAGLVARTRLARTEADAEACARTCGEAFAREDAERGLGWGHGYYDDDDDGGGGGGDDFVDVGRRVVETARRAADDAFTESIASELKTMTTHQINERVEASVKRRAMNVEKVEGMTNEELRRRRVELERLKRRSQCLTVLASLSASDDTDDDDDDDDDDGEEERIAGDESSSETEWIGSANIRVCAPEALFPEPFPTTKPRVPYISNVAVRRDARRRGVAGVMLDKCERAARVWGFPEVWIHVDVDNPIVRVAYERRGYVARSEDPWWYGFGGLFGKRRVLMVKRFTTTT